MSQQLPFVASYDQFVELIAQGAGNLAKITREIDSGRRKEGQRPVVMSTVRLGPEGIEWPKDTYAAPILNPRMEPIIETTNAFGYHGETQHPIKSRDFQKWFSLNRRLNVIYKYKDPKEIPVTTELLTTVNAALKAMSRTKGSSSSAEFLGQRYSQLPAEQARQNAQGEQEGNVRF